MKVNTHWNFVLSAADMEKPTLLASLTVPDETMSVKELLERFMSGQRIPDNLYREGVFDESSDFDTDDVEKLKHLDLVERGEVIERLKETQSAAKRELDAQKKRQDVIDLREKKRQRSLSALVSVGKKKKKGAAGPARVQGAKRPSKGADEGSE